MPRVENPDDVVGVCSECESDQPESYMERNPFAQQGSPVPCRFCGGVVIIVYREQRDAALNDAKRERGLS